MKQAAMLEKPYGKGLKSSKSQQETEALAQTALKQLSPASNHRNLEVIFPS
jgi:hypothetical protein